MKWSDRAIIISTRRLGENSAIITLLTPEQGLYKGVDRAAFSKARRGVYQLGNIVSAQWQARLAEQMGSVSCELLTPVAARIIDDARKLAVVNSATALVDKILMEREKHPEIFEFFESLINSLCSDGDYLADYVRLEFCLLASSGFGVDLERCAATGQQHELYYVSPRTGRAVSKGAGAPYHDKLLILPDFLVKRSQGGEIIKCEDIMDGLKLCGHFIGKRIFNFRGIPLPVARTRLMSILHRKSAEYVA